MAGGLLNQTGEMKPKSGNASAGRPQKSSSPISLDHYIRLILYRRWLVLGTFVVVTAATFFITYRMPDIYVSETVILVDPQKVPESYVKATVTGDVRNRLGTLSQQILSASRLQKVIDALNLYPDERRTLAREDVILKMRSDISVNVVSDFGGSQDLQAFRIRYSGRDPRLVAQVANNLATQFIDENLKAREAQATGTTDFLHNQLQEARRTLEAQEVKLRDFRLRHLGEMPEQQAADLQILGQLQSQMQLEGEALARADQQRTLAQTMMTQAAPVVDMDEPAPASKSDVKAPAARPSRLEGLKTQLAALQGHYTDQHPAVRKLKVDIAAEESRRPQQKQPEPSAETQEAPPAEPSRPKSAPLRMASSNPVLQSQIKMIEEEIAKHKQEQARLSKLIASYQRKLENIPINEQVIATLVRDYDISKAHYQQLLNNQLSAETATQLEVRQKGEKFTILDGAQPAERPSRPNRPLLNAGGSIAGLGLGLLFALITELLGVSITSPEQVTAVTSVAVLEVIPIIETQMDHRLRRRRQILAAVSAAAVTLIASGAFLFYRLRA